MRAQGSPDRIIAQLAPFSAIETRAALGKRRRAITTHLLWVGAVILAFSALLVFFTPALAGRAFRAPSNPFAWMFLPLATVGVFTIGVLLVQYAYARRMAPRLMRAEGSLCLACRTAIPHERPLTSASKPCCAKTAECLSDEELVDYWHRWLCGGKALRATLHAPLLRSIRSTGPGRSWLRWSFAILSPLLAFIAVVAVFSGVRGGFSVDRIAVSIIEMLPSSIGMFSVVIGFNLIAMGFGWRFERGPFCAKCGYRWTAAAGPHCPECGNPWAGVAGRRAHRTRRNPALMAAGAIVLIGGFGVQVSGVIGARSSIAPTALLFSTADFGAIYCPRIEALSTRTLTTAQDLEFARKTIEALEPPVDAPSTWKGAEGNYTAQQMLGSNLDPTTTTLDASLLSRGRAVLAQVHASIDVSDGTKPVLRFAGPGAPMPMAIVPGSKWLLVEAPTFERVEGAVDVTTQSPWGAPVQTTDGPGSIVGTLTISNSHRGSGGLALTTPVALPTQPGRYLVRVRRWLVWDPTPAKQLAPFNSSGTIVIPKGGWAEPYEHRFIVEVPAAPTLRPAP